MKLCNLVVSRLISLRDLCTCHTMYIKIPQNMRSTCAMSTSTRSQNDMRNVDSMIGDCTLEFPRYCTPSPNQRKRNPLPLTSQVCRCCHLTTQPAKLVSPSTYVDSACVHVRPYQQRCNYFQTLFIGQDWLKSLLNGC